MIDIYVEFCDSLRLFSFGFVGLSYKGYNSLVQHELEKHRKGLEFLGKTDTKISL